MEEIRKLSTILFADIAGYTSMMQKNESHALGLLNQFKALLEACVPEHKGSIVQYFGDGCLLSFESATDGVTCALALQSSWIQQEVPVRIGMHLGEVVFKNNNAFGDGVNIASRVESMGVPGSIIVSKVIRDQIKNKADFQLIALGAYHFKNVEAPMQIYALANEGLVVPNQREIKGKLKEDQSSLFQRLWRKKIPQILAVYILIAWLGLQLFDWALHQFGISPHWAQIFFITVLGIVPSLLVYLNHRERVRQGQLKLEEKILFPSNLILLGAVLFFMFRTADLGATSIEVTLTDKDGSEVTENIVKKEFRKQFPIFPFNPVQKDSVHEWVGYGVSELITFKINQNKYLAATSLFGKNITRAEKFSQSKNYNQDFYVDGQFGINNNQYEIIPAVRYKKTGEIIKEQHFSGTNLFSLVDSIGIFLYEAVGLTPVQVAESPDFSIREIGSDNLEAIKHFILGKTRLGNILEEYEKAILLDSTFAIASFLYAQRLDAYSRGQLEAKIAIDKAMRHRKRLPFTFQIYVMVLKHMIYEEWDKAEQLLKIQLELDPTNPVYNHQLSDLYFTTTEIDKLVRHTKNHFSNSPNGTTAYHVMMAQIMNGEPDKTIRNIKKFLLLDQQNVQALTLLGEAFIHKGDYDKAKEIFEKIILIAPETELNIMKSIDAVDYLKSKAHKQTDLSKFEGYYRTADSEMVIEMQIIGQHLLGKALHQWGGYNYLAGTHTLKHGTPGKGWTIEYFFDEMGEVLGDKTTENVGAKKFIYYKWKQDTLIWNAEAFLRIGDYENARILYQQAINKHPQHFYLYQAKQHLDYLQSNSMEAVRQNFQRLVGQYGEVAIWIENGLLYFKRSGNARRVLRPLSDNRFTTLLAYKINYEFVEKNGRILGIQRYDYDHETKGWEKQDDWFFERKKLLD